MLRRILATWLLAAALAASAGIINPPAGGSTVTNTFTNTVTLAPAWLAQEQTLAATNYDTTLTVNPTNGVTCWLWATNALESNVTFTLSLPTLSTNATPLTLLVPALNTAAIPGDTNQVTVSGAGIGDANQTYYWNADILVNVETQQGAYTNANNGFIIFPHLSFGGAWTIEDNGVMDYYTHEGAADGTYTSLDGGYDPAPTVVFSGGGGVPGGNWSVRWPANVLAGSGVAPALTNNTSSITTNRFDLLWNAARTNWVVSPNQMNLQPVVNP